MNNPDSNDERLSRLEASNERLEKGLRLLTLDMHDVKQAVIGDSKIGLDGLVKGQKDMRVWKNSIEIRVATISGGVAVATVVAGYFLKLLFHG